MRILICGCLYGAGNIGDEAILAGLLELLPPGAEVGVCVMGWDERYTGRGLKVFGHSKPEVLRAICWADLVLLGGGSLLTDPMGSGYPINNCAFILIAARALGKATVFAGIGAAPLMRPASLRIARQTYGYAARFLVRNEASRQAVISQLNVAPEKVFAAADPAFVLAGKASAVRGRELLASQGIQCHPGRRLIGVSVVNEGFETGRDYHRQLALACDALWRDHQCDVVFIHSEVRDGPAFDSAAAASVRALMTSPSQELPAQFYCPVDFASMLASFDCIIAMRMHVIILSALSGVPCAPLVREPKVGQILDDLGISNRSHIDSVQAAELTDSVITCLRERNRISEQLHTRVAALGARCRAAFDEHLVSAPPVRPQRLQRLASQVQLLRELLRSASRRLLHKLTRIA